MSNKKIRWSKVYESSEEELIALLRARNLESQRIIAAQSDAQTEQTVAHDFTLWCAEGSLVLRQGTTSVSLQPGDAVTVIAIEPYDLIAGITGYVCYVTR